MVGHDTVVDLDGFFAHKVTPFRPSRINCFTKVNVMIFVIAISESAAVQPAGSPFTPRNGPLMLSL